MRTWLYGAAGALLAAGLLTAPAASAAPISADPLRFAVEDMRLVDDAQYVYGGRRYCWYPDGWRGPGYYWCGYARRRGYGWGGPMGWRGWGPPVRRPVPRVYERRYDRRDIAPRYRRDFERRRYPY